MDDIALIGLGNPGREYADTRHNAGFWLVDKIADQLRVSLRTESKFAGEYGRVAWGKGSLHLLKPSTFMNRSGQSVAALAQFYKLSPAQLLVAHDELDLGAGTVRLKLGGGHGGHNGLRDIHKPVGEGYRRVRIGIGHPGDKALVLNYVLGRPNRADEDAIQSALDAVIAVLPVWRDQTWERAVHQLHNREAPAGKS